MSAGFGCVVSFAFLLVTSTLSACETGPADRRKAYPQEKQGQQQPRSPHGDPQPPTPQSQNRAAPRFRARATAGLQAPAPSGTRQRLGSAKRSGAGAKLRSVFLGADDSSIREALRTGSLATVKKGRGGRSLAFRITLDNGQVGYFKPEQSFSGAHYYGELAAHYLDRSLGLGRALPVIGRRFAWAQLRRAARGDKRLREVRVGKDGRVKGAFIAWIDEGVTPFRLRPGWEQRLRRGPTLRVSPFQRPAILRAIAANTQPNRPAGSRHPRALAPRALSEAQRGALSDLIVFDYLISNFDRWGGDFTNVRRRGKDGPLLFFDNGAAFWPNPRPHIQERRLHAIHRFRPTTIAALRRFRLRDWQERMASDPLDPVLEPARIDGVKVRVRALLDYIDELEQRGIDWTLPPMQKADRHSS